MKSVAGENSRRPYASRDKKSSSRSLQGGARFRRNQLIHKVAARAFFVARDVRAGSRPPSRGTILRTQVAMSLLKPHMNAVA
jgi:hypothetical protein